MSLFVNKTLIKVESVTTMEYHFVCYGKHLKQHQLVMSSVSTITNMCSVSDV